MLENSKIPDWVIKTTPVYRVVVPARQATSLADRYDKPLTESGIYEFGYWICMHSFTNLRIRIYFQSKSMLCHYCTLKIKFYNTTFSNFYDFGLKEDCKFTFKRQDVLKH
jgi:hypothetical protein